MIHFYLVFTLCKTLIPIKIWMRKEWAGGLRTFVAVSGWSIRNCKFFWGQIQMTDIFWSIDTVFYYNMVDYHIQLGAFIEKFRFLTSSPIFKIWQPWGGIVHFHKPTINWNGVFHSERAYLKFSTTPPSQPHLSYLPGLPNPPC